MSSDVEISVPDLGDFAEVTVIEVNVRVGDSITEDDIVLVLESDKATLDVPSPHAGTVSAVKVSEGDSVSAGTPILSLSGVSETGTAAEPVDQQRAAAPIAVLDNALAKPQPEESLPEHASRPTNFSSGAQPQKAPEPEPRPSAPESKPANLVYASPAIRRYARTLGVNLDAVTGTGPKGRIQREDVEAFVKRTLTAPTSTQHPMMDAVPPWPSLDYDKWGATERVSLSRIVRKSGPALTRNAMFIPHVCNFDKADITDTESFRVTLNKEAAAEDAKVTMLTFAVKAVVQALKTYPKFNASLDGDELVLKKYWNIGVAADTPDGLVVPVVKQADQKSLREIANEMSALAAAARLGKLKPSDMQGATFTISSLGGIGGTNFTPIINAPEVAILGMVRAEMQPQWDGKAFQPRLVQPLSLSWDHRVVDGVAAARFLSLVAQSMSDIRRVLV